MASFRVLLLLPLFIMATPLPSDSQLIGYSDNNIPTLPSSPVSMSDPPLSPFEQLSPDIAPLFPSPGGAVPTTGATSMPTIPSSPSPPNPDDLMAAAAGPAGSAFPPFGSLPPSISTSPGTSLGSLNSIGSFFICGSLLVRLL